MTTPDVRSVLAALPVTRLTHFTPARNVPLILADGLIRSSDDLRENSPDVFSPTDRERYDNRDDLICCSFEYPNVYYLRQARQKADYVNYPDWVCFLLNPHLIERPETQFCGCNASRSGGAYQRAGAQALVDLWADPSQPMEYRRGPHHHPGVPTDLQAEVLIPGPIELSDVQAIVVPSAEVAGDLYATYRRWALEPERLVWKVAPLFFQVTGLTSRLQNGGTIEEQTWQPEGAQ